MMDWPCHSKPKSEWCDRDGLGDFMGHTCRTMARVVAKARLREAKRQLQKAEDVLAEASAKFMRAVAELDATDEPPTTDEKEK
jgi:hypothetical protein